MRGAIRLKQYSLRTEEAYVGWDRRFVLWHGKRHPRELGNGEVQAFLEHLSGERNVAASTQSQALNALVFLYKEVLDVPLGAIGEFARARWVVEGVLRRCER